MRARSWSSVATAVAVLAGTAVTGTMSAQASATTTVHVATAHASASDSNPGTPELPLKTISAGVKRGEAATARGDAAVVTVHPGTYRESVAVGMSGVTTAPLTIQAAAPGVVVSGADVWTGWQQRSPGIWQRSWPYTWGQATPPSTWPDVDPLLLRRELVVVDGRLLRQVLSESDLTRHDGAYFVDEGSGQLLVKAPGSVDLASATVEVATRTTGLTANKRHDLTVRGMTFRHVATAFQRGAVMIDGTRNLTVEGSRFSHNSWAGLQLLNVTGAAVRGNAMDDNGVLGLTAWRSSDLLFEDNSTNRNNTTRGAWAGHSRWEEGSKLYRTHRVTFRRHVAVGNNAPGLWFDTDNTDVVVEDSFFADNARYGFEAELSQGPVLFRRNRVCGNGSQGFMNSKSRNVTLEQNEIFDNVQEAVSLSGPAGSVTITDFETGQAVSLRNENFTLRDNLLSQPTTRLVRNNLQQADWDHMKPTFTSSGNRWHSTLSAPFVIPGRWVTLDGWRSDTGQDRTSTLSTSTPAGLSCTAPAWSTPAPAPTTEPVPAPAPTTEPVPAPTTEPVPAPTTEPAPAPAPTTASPTPEVGLGPATSYVSYSDEWSDNLTGKRTTRSYVVAAEAGRHAAELQVLRGSPVTLEVLDAAGVRVGTVTGSGTLRWQGVRPSGSTTYVVSGDKATSYQLRVQVLS